MLFEHQEEQDALRGVGKVKQRHGVVRQTIHDLLYIVSLKVRVRIRGHRSPLSLLGPMDDLVVFFAAASSAALKILLLIFLL